MGEIPDRMAAELARFHCRKNFTFRRHTTLGVGGNAPLALFPRGAAELASAFCCLRAAGIPHCMLGNGSNMLVSDAGFDGAVIATKEANALSVRGDIVAAESGAPLSTLLAAAARASLDGAAFVQGIPATVGGALFMNAGAGGRCMADIVRSVTALIGGKVCTLSAAECAFGYKDSIFQKEECCILSAEFKLKKGDLHSILSDIDRVKERRSALPRGRSMGCVFRNAGGRPAGELIERAGCKGMTCGGAYMSREHANFLINRGDATAADCATLIASVRARVLAQTGIRLKEEIRYIGVF